MEMRELWDVCVNVSTGNPEAPIKILTEEGDVFNIIDLVWDETNQTYYLKVVLAED